MKTNISLNIVLIICLAGWLGSPAYAAFGDDTSPPPSLSGDNAAGSALPPGTYPSSPADSDKKTDSTPKQDSVKPASKPKHHSDKTQPSRTPRTGS